jgi:peptidoglycan/xylan/chitin deacetylase (PgdA/CDA1 family)
MRFVLAVMLGMLAFVGAAHATVVSLEFDDGTTDQRQVVPLLEAHGYKATFFVNSGRIGKTSHMSWGQLADLQADGHEVTGHTIDHVHLTQVSTDTARTQICDDRTRLLSHGLPANDFAYPFGDHDAAVEQLVEGCGYSSGRAVSGLDSIVACHGCPLTETIPPKDPYATRIPDSVRETTTLDQLETFVGRGGWIQLLMHHVCDGCDTYSVSKSTLSALLDYLATQPSVTVKTVAEVMDPNPPFARVAAPADGASGTGTTTITAGVSGAVRRVRFFADGKQLGTRTSSPWRWKWNTTDVARGTHTLRVLVEGADGNAGLSPETSFTLT